MASAEVEQHVVEQQQEEEEERAVFDKQMYPDGPNADFLVSKDGVDIVTKFAGESGEKGGKFEDIEKRDIAKAVPAIINLLNEKTSTPLNGMMLDVGSGTGLLLKPLSELVPEGKLYASDISPDFRKHLVARAEKEKLDNVEVVEASEKEVAVLSSSQHPLPPLNTVLMIDVYHHLEFPRTICRKLRKLMAPEGRLVVIDFFRDSTKITSFPPEWVMQHLRAGQDEFREEILSSGFVLVDEPTVDELKENYVMIFRPCTDEEMGRNIGAGWANNTIPVEQK